MLVAEVVYTTGSSLYVNMTTQTLYQQKSGVLISRVELISLCLPSTPRYAATCHSRDPDNRTVGMHKGVMSDEILKLYDFAHFPEVSHITAALAISTYAKFINFNK